MIPTGELVSPSFRTIYIFSDHMITYIIITKQVHVTDHDIGPWKTDRPYCWVPSSTGLGKISENIIWAYKVDFSLNMKVQANTFKNQGVTSDLSFLSSSKTLTPSKLHQNGHGKLHWSHRN